MRLHLALALAALAVAACLDEEEPGLATTEQAIDDGWTPSHFDRDRTVRVSDDCTGVFIAPQFAITALHCAVGLGDAISFYGTSSSAPAFARTIAKFGSRPGTQWNAHDEDWTDEDGLFADFVIVRLDAPVTGRPFATLAWRYPGDGAAGHKVGAGRHDGEPNVSGALRRKDDVTYSGDDGGGGFLTSEFALDPGDSGGPLFWNDQLLGVANGSMLVWVQRARYTSVVAHLDWILDVIDYVWPGTAPQWKTRSGQPLAGFVGSSLIRCEYACDHTGGCVAFDWSPFGAACQLLSSNTGATPSSFVMSAVK